MEVVQTEDRRFVRDLQSARWKWHPNRKYWSKSLLVNPQAADFAKELVNELKGLAKDTMESRRRVAYQRKRPQKELIF